MVINSNSQKLTAAGSDAVKYCKNNASLTVVTETNNYLVTIRDWNATQTLYAHYAANPKAFNHDVINKTTQYGSYEAAILSAFGDSVNLYTDGGLATYYPLSVNSTTHAV